MDGGKSCSMKLLLVFIATKILVVPSKVSVWMKYGFVRGLECLLVRGIKLREPVFNPELRVSAVGHVDDCSKVVDEERRLVET